MNISKSLMAILLASILAISSTSLTSNTYATDHTDTAPVAESEGIVDDDPQRPTTPETPTVSTLYKEAYDHALEEVKPYNKLEALHAATTAVYGIPKFRDLLETELALHQVKGSMPVNTNVDNAPMLEILTNIFNQSIADPESFAHLKLATLLSTESGTVNETKLAQMKQKTFAELITLGKSDSRYSATPAPASLEEDNQIEELAPAEAVEMSADPADEVAPASAEALAAEPTADETTEPVVAAETPADNATFSRLVDDCEAMYNAGVKKLRIILPVLGASSTGIEAMNGESLASLAKTVPEYEKYGFYAANGDIVDAPAAYKVKLYATALGATYVEMTERTKTVENYDNQLMSNAYASIVAVGKSVDPNFTVDLSKLQKLPSLPNTGSIFDSENSAALITLAVGGIAAAVAAAGLGITAKRFLFSPLKRRR